MAVKERNFFYDNLKFILITLVVIGHLLFFSIEFNSTKTGVLFIYLFHMPLFIFITGFLAKHLTDKEGKFKLNKVFSFLLTYLVFNVLVFFEMKFLLGRDVQFSFFSETDCPWYLLALAIWYVITYLLKNIKPKYLLIFSIILGIVVGYDDGANNSLVLSRVVVFYPFFLAGYYLSKEALDKLVAVLNRVKYKIISIIGLLAILLFFYFFVDDLFFLRGIMSGQNPYSYVDIPFDIPLTGAVTRTMIYVFSVLASLMLLSLVPKKKTFFSKFGSRTMQVYVLHFLIILFIAFSDLNNLFAETFGEAVWIFYVVLGIVISFVLSARIFEKPFQKLMNIDYSKIYVKEKKDV